MGGTKALILIRRFLCSTGFFYITAGILTGIYISNHSALGVAKLRTLNRLMPPLARLVDSNRSGSVPEAEYLDLATFYYRKVTDYLPANPNGYFMYGYCLALSDENEAAAAAFDKAAVRNPGYFWAHYNRGLMRLRLGQLAQAEEAFRAALDADPAVTVKVILASKVFQQLLVNVEDPQAVIVPGLKAGYADCRRWLAVIGRLKGLSDKGLPPQIYNQLRPVIF